MIQNMEDKINQLLENRLLALSQKKEIGRSQIETDVEIETIQEYLFGNSSERGLIDLLSFYAREIGVLEGSTFSAPSNLTGNSKSSWENQFQLAMRTEGDGATGFYPPNQYGIGQEDINESSLWLTTHGYSQKSNGLLGTLGKLNQKRDALWQRRIEEYPPEDPNNTGIINPDYFSNPEKEELLEEIESTVNALDDYLLFLEELKTFVDQIKGGTNNIFNFQNIKDDIDSFSQNNIVEIENYKEFYEDAYEYLSTVVSSPSTRDKINDYISPSSFHADRSLVLHQDLVESYISIRVASLKSSMGFSSLSIGLKKWIYFFIRLLIDKPVSPYGTKVGLATAKEKNLKQLASIWGNLNILFGDSNKYIPTPSLIASYILPDENSSNGIRSEVVFQTIPSVPVVRIWKKLVTWTTALENTPWTTGGDVSMEEIDMGTTPVLVYRDKDLPTPEGQLYVYRIDLRDQGPNRIDLHNSGSEQSVVLGEEIPLVVKDTREVEMLDHSFSSGEFLYIDGSGIFQILSTTQNTFFVNRDLPASGSIQRLFGTIHLSV